MPAIDSTIRLLENYIECWKQFSRFLTMADSKKFTQEDEERFLELKSLLTQQLEMVLADLEGKSPPRGEVHELISSAPSLRFLSEARDDTLRGAENRWHKLYIEWQSILGQLKVKQRADSPPSRFKGWFGTK